MTTPAVFPRTLLGWAQLVAICFAIIGGVFGGVAFMITRNAPPVYSEPSELLLERLDSIIETQGEIRNDIRDLQGDVDNLKVDTGELKTDVQWLKLLLPNTRADTTPPR